MKLVKGDRVVRDLERPRLGKLRGLVVKLIPAPSYFSQSEDYLEVGFADGVTIKTCAARWRREA